MSFKKVRCPLGNAHRLLSPRIAYIITTMDGKDKTNAAPISNLTSISTRPEALVLAVYPEWTTCSNIRKTREFVVNVPGQNLLDEVWICGDKYSGISIPSNLNKISIARLTEIPSIKVRPPGLAECYAHLECEVVWTRTIGDHILVLADIVFARHNEEAFGTGSLLNIKKFKPVMQISGPHFSVPNDDIMIDEEKVRLLVLSRIGTSKAYMSKK